jgi:hypothetical protein
MSLNQASSNNHASHNAQRKCGCGNCEEAWFADGWCCQVETDTAVASELSTMKPEHKDGIVFLEVPQAVIGRLFGVGGKTLKMLQEVSNCSIRVESKEDRSGEVKQARSVKIISRAPCQGDRDDGAETCAHAVKILCAEEDLQVETAFSKALEEQEVRMQCKQIDEEAECIARKKRQQAEVVSYVYKTCGDAFDEESICKALDKENWDPNEAMNRLYNDRCQEERKSSAYDKLLEASRVANAARRMNEQESTCSPVLPSPHSEPADAPKPSKNAMLIHDAVAKAVAKGVALKEKEMRAVAPQSVQQQHNHGHQAQFRLNRAGVRSKK